MKISDLFETNHISIISDASMFGFLSEAGAGRVVKGVNTTPDVGIDEIPKQAAKFKIKVTRDGYPPVARSDGKIPKI